MDELGAAALPSRWPATRAQISPHRSTGVHGGATPALAADAFYKKLVTTNDAAIFAYTREKQGHKIAVVLNLSNQPQRFTIKEKSIYGQPMNVFLGMKEKLHREHVYSIEPWGYIVYDY